MIICMSKKHGGVETLYIYVYIYRLNTPILCDMQIVTTSAYVIILTSVIFGHKLQTIHKHIYVFIQSYNSAYFAYEFLYVNGDTVMISQTLKNNITSRSN